MVTALLGRRARPGHPAPADPADWPTAWLLLAGDGAAPAAPVLAALAAASRLVDGYRGPNARSRGGPGPSAAGLDLVRGIVRDSLHAAPQPVRPDCVRYTLAVIGGLGRVP